MWLRSPARISCLEDGYPSRMSRSVRWVLALLLVALGAALLAFVWKPLGIAIAAIGFLVMPWYAGMAGAADGD